MNIKPEREVIVQRAISMLKGSFQPESEPTESGMDFLRASVIEEVRAEDSSLMAQLISSDLLNDQIWVISDRGFTPVDGFAMYYVEEVALLKVKTSEDLKVIHQVKLAFPGCRVIQEGKTN